MQVVLATYGTRGDVEPMVALAAELRAAGASVRLVAPPDEEFRSVLARGGVETVGFTRSWRSWEAAETTAKERVPSIDEFVGGHFDATYGDLAAAAEGADAIVATGMLHFVAGTIAERDQIAQHFVVFASSLLEPKPYQPLVRDPINTRRAKAGLPPIDDVQRYLLTARPWLAADPLLDPPRDLPGDEGRLLRSAERFGAWILPDQRPLPPSLEAFLDRGAPPVFVGFGSMRVPRDSAVATIEAVRATGHRIVLGRGWAQLDAIDAAADDAIAVDEVNQQALFARCAAVVHHGGAGTTNAATRAGIPQVVVPQIADQPHWGARIAELGCGAVLSGPDPTPAEVLEALGSALAPPTAAEAAEVARRMQTDGAAVAAQRLLATAHG